MGALYDHSADILQIDLTPRDPLRAGTVVTIAFDEDTDIAFDGGYQQDDQGAQKILFVEIQFASKQLGADWFEKCT